MTIKLVHTGIGWTLSRIRLRVSKEKKKDEAENACTDLISLIQNIAIKLLHLYKRMRLHKP